MSSSTNKKPLYAPQQIYASSSNTPSLRSARGGAASITTAPPSQAPKSSKLPAIPAAVRNRQQEQATSFSFGGKGFSSSARHSNYNPAAQGASSYVHPSAHSARRHGRNARGLPSVELAVDRKSENPEEEKVQLPIWPRSSDHSRRALVTFLSSPTQCHLFLDYCEIRTVGSTLDHMIALGSGLDETSPTMPTQQQMQLPYPTLAAEQANLAALLLALQKLDELGHRFNDINALVDTLEGQVEMNLALRSLYPTDPSRRNLFRLVFEYLSGSDCELFSESPIPVNASTGEIEILLDAGGYSFRNRARFHKDASSSSDGHDHNNNRDEQQFDEGDQQQYVNDGSTDQDAANEPSTALEIMVHLDAIGARFQLFSELVAAVGKEKSARVSALSAARIAGENLLANQREKLTAYFAEKAAQANDEDSVCVFFPQSRRLVLKKGEIDALVKAGGGQEHMDEMLYLLELIELAARNAQAKEKFEAATAGTTVAAGSRGASNNSSTLTSPTNAGAAANSPNSPLLFINDVPQLISTLHSTYEKAVTYKQAFLRWLNSKSNTMFMERTSLSSQENNDHHLSPSEEEDSEAAQRRRTGNLKQFLEREAARIYARQDNRRREMKGMRTLPLPPLYPEEEQQHQEDNQPEEKEQVYTISTMQKQASKDETTDFVFTPAVVDYLFLISGGGFSTLAHAQRFQNEGRHFASLEKFAIELARAHRETEKERDIIKGRNVIRQYVYSKQCKLFSLTSTGAASIATASNNANNNNGSASPITASSIAQDRFSLGNGSVDLSLTNADIDILIKVCGGSVNLSLLYLRHFDFYQHRYFSWSALVSAVESRFTKAHREHAAYQLLQFLSHPNCSIFRIKEKEKEKEKKHAPHTSANASTSANVEVLDVETGDVARVEATAAAKANEQIHVKDQPHSEHMSFSTAVLRAASLVDELVSSKTRQAPGARGGNNKQQHPDLSAPTIVTAGLPDSNRMKSPSAGQGTSGASGAAATATTPASYTVTNLTLRDMHRLYEASSAGPETLWHLQQITLYEPHRPALKDLDELISLIRRNHCCLVRKIESDLPFLKQYLFQSSKLASVFFDPLTEIYDEYFVRIIMACGGSAAAAIYFLSRVSAEEGSLRAYRDTPGLQTTPATNLDNTLPPQTASGSQATTKPTTAVAGGRDKLSTASGSRAQLGTASGNRDGTSSSSSKQSSNPSAYLPPCLRFEDPYSLSQTAAQAGAGKGDSILSSAAGRDALLQTLEALQNSRVGSTGGPGSAPPMWVLVEIQNFLNAKGTGIWKKKTSSVQVTTKDGTIVSNSRPGTQQGARAKAAANLPKNIAESQLAAEESARRAKEELELTLTHALDEENVPDVPFIDLTTVGEMWNELGGMGLQIIPHLLYFAASARQNEQVLQKQRQEEAASAAAGGKKASSTQHTSSNAAASTSGAAPNYHIAPCKPCESLGELIETLRRVHLHLFVSAGTAKDHAPAQQRTGSLHSHIQIVLTYLYSPISSLLPRPEPKDIYLYTTYLHPVNVAHLHYNHTTTFWTSNPAVFSLTTSQVSQLLRVLNSNHLSVLRSVPAEEGQEVNDAVVSGTDAESFSESTSSSALFAEEPANVLAVLIELDVACQKQSMEMAYVRTQPPMEQQSPHSLSAGTGSEGGLITSKPSSFLAPDEQLIPTPFRSFQPLLYWLSRIAASRLEDKMAMLSKLTATDPTTGLSLFFHENLPIHSEIVTDENGNIKPAEASQPAKVDDPTVLASRSHVGLSLGDLSSFFSTSGGGGLEGLPPSHDLICTIFWKLVKSGATFASFAGFVSSMRTALLYVVHSARQEKLIVARLLRGAGMNLISPPPPVPPTDAQVAQSLKDQANGLLKRIASSSNNASAKHDDSIGDINCVATYPHLYQSTRTRCSELEVEALLTHAGSNQACVAVYWIMRVLEMKQNWDKDPSQHKLQYQSFTSPVNVKKAVSRQTSDDKVPATPTAPSVADSTATESDNMTPRPATASGNNPNVAFIDTSSNDGVTDVQAEELPPGYLAANPFTFRDVYSLAHFINDLRYRDATARQQELSAYLEQHCPLFGAIPSVFITRDAVDKVYWESMPGASRRIVSPRTNDAVNVAAPMLPIVPAAVDSVVAPISSGVSNTGPWSLLPAAPGDVLFHLWCFESLGLTADSLYDLIDHLKAHVNGLGERRRGERMTLIAILGQPAVALLRYQRKDNEALTQAQIQEKLSESLAHKKAAAAVARANQQAKLKDAMAEEQLSELDSITDEKAAASTTALPQLNTQVYAGRRGLLHGKPLVMQDDRAGSGLISPTGASEGFAFGFVNSTRPFFSGFHTTLGQLDGLLSAAGRSILMAIACLLELHATQTSQGEPLNFVSFAKLNESVARWYEHRRSSESNLAAYLNQPTAASATASTAGASGALIQPKPPSRAGTAAAGGRAAIMAASVSNESNTSSSSNLAFKGKCILFSHAPLEVYFSPSLLEQVFVYSGAQTDSALLSTLQTLNESIHSGWSYFGTSFTNPEQLLSLLRREDEFFAWRKKYWNRDLLTGGAVTNQSREIAHLVADQFGVAVRAAQIQAAKEGNSTSTPAAVNYLSPQYLLDRFRESTSFSIRIPVPLAQLAGGLELQAAALAEAEEKEKERERTRAARGKNFASPGMRHRHVGAGGNHPSSSHPTVSIGESYEDDFENGEEGPKSAFLPGAPRLGSNGVDWDEVDIEPEEMTATEKMRALEREIAAEEEAERKAEAEAKEAKRKADEEKEKAAADGTTLDGESADSKDGLAAVDAAGNRIVAVGEDGTASAESSTVVDGWYYLDDSLIEQGPFSFLMMRDWFMHGSLPPTLLVKTAAEFAEDETRWRPISTRQEFVVVDPETLASTPISPAAGMRNLAAKAQVPQTVTVANTHVHASSRNSLVPGSLPSSVAGSTTVPALTVSTSSSTSNPPPHSPPGSVRHSSTFVRLGTATMVQPPPPPPAPAAPNLYEQVHEIDALDPDFTLDSKFANSSLLHYKPAPTISTVVEKTNTGHAVAPTPTNKDTPPSTTRSLTSNNAAAKDSGASTTAAGAKPPLVAQSSTTKTTAAPAVATSATSSTTGASTTAPTPTAAAAAAAAAPGTTATAASVPIDATANPSAASLRSMGNRATSHVLEDNPDDILQPEDIKRLEAEKAAAEEERRREELYNVDEFAIDDMNFDGDTDRKVIVDPASLPAPKISLEKVFFNSEPEALLKAEEQMDKDELDFDLADHDLPSLATDDTELDLGWDKSKEQAK